MAEHNRHNRRQESTPSEFDEKVIQVSRVSKKTKGGNKMGFSVLMVVGDKKGRVGVGLGKATDVQSAVRKGVKKAKKKLITVPMDGTTIPFPLRVKQGAASILLKPAPKGSGVIAGGPIRAVVEAAGIRDISSKIMGTGNQASNVYATFEALKRIEKLVTLKGIKLKSVAESEAEEARKVEEAQQKAKETAQQKEIKADEPVKAAKVAAEKVAKVAKPKVDKPAKSTKPAATTEVTPTTEVTEEAATK